MRSLWLAACALLCISCLPSTHLDHERGGRGPPALVALVEPAPGGSAPRNLAAVVLRLATGLRAGEPPPRAHLRAEADSAEVALGPAAPVACTGAGRCYAFALPERLPAGGYLVESPAPALLDDGRALPAAIAGQFLVGDADDAAPPALSSISLEAEGPCLRARFTTDEPTRAALVLRGAAPEEVLPAGEAATAFEVVARVRDPTVTALVRAVDWAGNQAESPPAPVVFPALPLVITEVLANPAGPEATQEFVEVLNAGDVPAAFEGLLVEDAAGADPLPPLALAPGARALIVPAAYDAAAGSDPEPRPGTTLLRVEGRIGRDGLGNAGEVIRLRRKSGEILSRYGGWVSSTATAWVGRSVQRISPDSCDRPEAWSTRPQLPTPGW